MNAEDLAITLPHGNCAWRKNALNLLPVSSLIVDMATAAPESAKTVRSSNVDIQPLVAQLASLKREHGIELYRKIGEVVLRGIFSNDWKSVAKEGNAHPSFQALAKHPGVSFSASTLWRAVQISELLKRMPKVKESSDISVGHLRAVLGLPHERQEQLLRVVVAERLSVEATLDRAGRERPKSRRGRKAVPPLLRQLGRLERLASTSAPLKGLDEEGKKRAYEKAKELRDWAADMMKKISGSRAS